MVFLQGLLVYLTNVQLFRWPCRQHASFVNSFKLGPGIAMNSFEHFQHFDFVPGRWTQDGVDILLLDHRPAARALGFGFELVAKLVHIELLGLALGSLNTIPGNV